MTLSQIRKQSGNAYIVVIDAGDDSVKASFEVSLITRQRGRYNLLEHHTEIEKLEALAKERVLLFCRKLAAG
jgi:hypothetical protein